jgi:hypothetical protein
MAQLRVFQDQASKINEQLGSMHDQALKTNTQLATLLSRGALFDANGPTLVERHGKFKKLHCRLDDTVNMMQQYIKDRE